MKFDLGCSKVTYTYKMSMFTFKGCRYNTVDTILQYNYNIRYISCLLLNYKRRTLRFFSYEQLHVIFFLRYFV